MNENKGLGTGILGLALAITIVTGGVALIVLIPLWLYLLWSNHYSSLRELVCNQFQMFLISAGTFLRELVCNQFQMFPSFNKFYCFFKTKETDYKSVPAK